MILSQVLATSSSRTKKFLLTERALPSVAWRRRRHRCQSLPLQSSSRWNLRPMQSTLFQAGSLGIFTIAHILHFTCYALRNVKSAMWKPSGSELGTALLSSDFAENIIITWKHETAGKLSSGWKGIDIILQHRPALPQA